MRRSESALPPAGAAEQAFSSGDSRAEAACRTDGPAPFPFHSWDSAWYAPFQRKSALSPKETKAPTSAIPLSLPAYRPLTPRQNAGNGITAVGRRALLRLQAACSQVIFSRFPPLPRTIRQLSLHGRNSILLLFIANQISNCVYHSDFSGVCQCAFGKSPDPALPAAGQGAGPDPRPTDRGPGEKRPVSAAPRLFRFPGQRRFESLSDGTCRGRLPPARVSRSLLRGHIRSFPGGPGAFRRRPEEGQG